MWYYDFAYFVVRLFCIGEMFVKKWIQKIGFLQKIHSPSLKYMSIPENSVCVFTKTIHNNSLDTINSVNHQIIYPSSFLSLNLIIPNWKFISLSLVFLEHTIDINLQPYNVDKKKNNNFYVVGNQFNADFYLYYLATYLNEYWTLDKLNQCEITIIDKNAKIVMIKPTDTIVIKENNYEIIYEKLELEKENEENKKEENKKED